MQVQQVRFDEVFDVVDGRGDFSFRSRGRVEYGVHLHPGVVPRSGATYAVAFGESGNWATVLGWRDLASTEARLKESTWMMWLSELEMLFWVGLVAMLGALTFGGVAAMLAVLLVVIGIVAYPMYRIARRNRAVKQALLGFEAEPAARASMSS